MQNRRLSRPEREEFELSVFGPGYGESIALHVGNAEWLLVDSCLEPKTHMPASLHYLKELGVDVENAVRLIVATHWHDDHIQGLSAQLGGCKTAKLAVSGALGDREFTKLVELCSRGSMAAGSGLDEFVRVFQVLQERKTHGAFFNAPKFASADKLLYRSDIPIPAGRTAEAKVYSLSPSDTSILQATIAFSSLLPAYGDQKKRILAPAPNHASVVLWVEVGNVKVLLGSDLETTPDPGTGWSVILNESSVIAGKADVFKVAHHGAASAHEPRVWSQLLSEDPWAVLSPFSRGGTILPIPKDVARITDLTPKAYITAPPSHRQHAWRERIVRESLREVTRNMRNVHSGWGHIRIRRKILTNSGWHVDLFGDACSLN